MNNIMFGVTIDRINNLLIHYNDTNATRFGDAVDEVERAIFHANFTPKDWLATFDIINILNFIDEDLRAHVALRKEKNKCNTGTTKLTNETDSDGN